MSTLFTIIVFAVVIAGAVVLVYCLFKASPFASHDDQFRDPRTGEPRGEGPHLE
jgi:hypothetical protein